MMECKKALTENNGDVEAAADWLRKTGLAKADKKASRVAAEGRIVAAQNAGTAVLVEVNSETDFVAKDTNFLSFVDQVGQAALAASDVEGLKRRSSLRRVGGRGACRRHLQVGENVQVRRMARIREREHARRVRARRPHRRDRRAQGRHQPTWRAAWRCTSRHEPAVHLPGACPGEFVAKEKEIALAQVKDRQAAGDPREDDLGQGQQDRERAVASPARPTCSTQPDGRAGAQGRRRGRRQLRPLAVGEGIEKQTDDFAAEVMKQAGLA